MRAEGTVEVAASPDTAWVAVTDPSVIVACVPGVEGVSVEAVGPATFRLRTRIGQGLLSLPVDARGELSDLERPVRGTCTISASMAGNALEGVIHVALSEAGPCTRAAWDAEVTLRGPLAGIAGQLVEREAPGLIERTIACLRERIEADEAGRSGAAAGPHAAP